MDSSRIFFGIAMCQHSRVFIGIGVAKKLARICWAVWMHQRNYDGDFALRHAA